VQVPCGRFLLEAVYSCMVSAGFCVGGRGCRGRVCRFILVGMFLRMGSGFTVLSSEGLWLIYQGTQRFTWNAKHRCTSMGLIS
jgi:hypothetical protein